MVTGPTPEPGRKNPVRDPAVTRRANDLGIHVTVLRSFGATDADGRNGEPRIRTPLRGGDLTTTVSYQDRVAATGKKLTERGADLSRAHCFAPVGVVDRLAVSDVALVCEGLTDAAVAEELLEGLDVGAVAVGSVAANRMVTTAMAVAQQIPAEATLLIVADGDTPGVTAAVEAGIAVREAHRGLAVGVLCTAEDLDADCAGDRAAGAEALREALDVFADGGERVVPLWPSRTPLPDDRALRCGEWTATAAARWRSAAEVAAIVAHDPTTLASVTLCDPVSGAEWRPPGTLGELWENVCTVATSHAPPVHPLGLLGALVALGGLAPPHGCDLDGGSPLGSYLVLVGEPGSGKTTTLRLAKRLLPARARPDVRITPASGQAIAERLQRPRRDEDGPDAPPRVFDARKRRALITADEWAQIHAAALMDGSIVRAILRSAWAGAEIRTDTASGERIRHVPDGGVRFAAIAGGHPAAVGGWLTDSATLGEGDADRWLLVAAVSGTAARLAAAETARLRWRSLPPDPSGGKATTWTGPRAAVAAAQRITDSVADWPVGIIKADQAVETRAARLYAWRGAPAVELDVLPEDRQPTPDDRAELARTHHGAHTELMRLRVAATLAALAGDEPRIQAAHWDTAGALLAAGATVRRLCLDADAEQAAIEQAAIERRHAQRAVASASAVRASEHSAAISALTQAAADASRTVHRRAHDGTWPPSKGGTASQVTHTLRSERRRVLRDLQIIASDVAAEAVSQGWLIIDGDGHHQPGAPPPPPA